jgi:hypothetical protein
MQQNDYSDAFSVGQQLRFAKSEAKANRKRMDGTRQRGMSKE